MSDRQSFRAWLDQAIAEAPRTAGGIPLIGADVLDLKDAQAAPLIVALADIRTGLPSGGDEREEIIDLLVQVNASPSIPLLMKQDIPLAPAPAGGARGLRRRG